jgi:hypothetical protein
MSTLIGTIHSLWRYPVKSMQGEQLTEVEVVPRGILGDRVYALWDVQTQRVASAKNPKKWAQLLEFHAQFPERPTVTDPAPAVTLTLPGGDQVDSDHPQVAVTLSQLLGREVQVLNEVPDAVSLDKFVPANVPGMSTQEEITQLFLPTGTFFDSCNIHLLTTATLAKLQSLYPAGAFKPCRFRPNILIDPVLPEGTNNGFVEEAWIGSVLGIGDEVRLQIDTICPRCVVTTLAQQGLPQDMEILRTTAIHNQVNAGIRASVIQGGQICQGDRLVLDP